MTATSDVPTSATSAAAPTRDAASATFRIAIGADPANLEPVTLTGQTANVMDYMIETLVQIDATGAIQPKLATAWEVSADNTTVTFTLREGVTFHDGTPFNAEAVKFSLERWLNPEVRPPNVFVRTLLQKIEVVDDMTVAVTTGYSPGLLLTNFVWTGYGIISPASVNTNGNTPTEYVYPIGTGPFAFKEQARGERLVVQKFAGYWGEKPYYESIEFRVAPEAATRESLLLAGQVDLMIQPPVADLPALQQNPNVKVLTSPGARAIFLGMNTGDPALSDNRVRQALNYAIDKEAITKYLMLGAADVMDSPVAPNLFGHCKVGPYPYDPERARALLAEANVQNLTLNFIAPTGRFLQDFQVAQAVAGYLSEVGVEATPATMEYSAYLGMLFTPPPTNTIQLHYFGFAPPAPDAGQPMFFLLHSSQQIPRGLNTAFYNNPEYDALVDQAGAATDPAERQEAYCKAQQLVWDDAPWIFLFYERFPVAHSAKVENISFLPGEKVNAIYARPVP
jgi:peptide/nickel transport system substrate-binding protein